MADDEGVTQVTRSVDVDAGADAVWEAIADPERRAAWLDDDDAAGRAVRVDEVDDGRRLVWTWWRPDGDEPDASTVEIAVRPLLDGGTRVVITETPLVAGPAASALRASAAAGGSASAAGRWDMRLLGLELLFVAAGACVL
jgi:uncharacterized protein YndB with AHSA1/START domain